MSTSIGSTEIDVWIACQHCWNTRNFKSRISWKRMDTGTCFPQMMQMYISVVLCVEVARKSFQSVRLHENIKIAWQDTNRYHRLVVFPSRFHESLSSHESEVGHSAQMNMLQTIHYTPSASNSNCQFEACDGTRQMDTKRSYQQIFITTTPCRSVDRRQIAVDCNFQHLLCIHLSLHIFQTYHFELTFQKPYQLFLLFAFLSTHHWLWWF